MQEIYCGCLRKIISNKGRLEKELEIKITNKGKLIFIEGDPEKEFIAIEILKAIDLGFSIDCSLLLKQENNLLHILNIKDLTKRKDLERVRARIIGTQGKTISTLKNLTECNICLNENQIGIIGDAEEIEDAIQALTSLVKGSKQGNVYARLEKHRKQKRIHGKINIKNDLD